MSTVNRRVFMGGMAGAGAALAFGGFAARAAALTTRRDARGYGPLTPTKSSNTSETLLALPKGFAYTVMGRTGTVMSDGRPTPGGHDGMAAFRVGGQLRLVRNHELNNRVGRAGVAIGGEPYDEMAGGGTTTLIIDPRTRTLVKDFVSLSGTLQNCAGGPTPWGSWISCEETTLGPQNIKDENQKEAGGFAKGHGYCFEVPAAADRPSAPVALKEMGRFVHEAIAVDPRTGIVYETEDRLSAGFYRFIPHRRGRLAAGGRLQMLAIKDAPDSDLRTGQKAGVALRATWVNIPDPDPREAETDVAAVYRQGRAAGGATFARLEGAWYGDGRLYFTSTNGGDRKKGQVWEYLPEGTEGGRLKLIYESPGAEVLDMPDNICVSPRGSLLICEDGGTDNYVRGLTPQGELFDFARNIVTNHENKEFAGSCFSPDGQILFVNIQTPGITFAIWGPWADGAL